jgi:hypothetical protein
MVDGCFNGIRYATLSVMNADAYEYALPRHISLEAKDDDSRKKDDYLEKSTGDSHE